MPWPAQLRLAQRNNRYSVGQMLLALLYPMILGLERIETPSCCARMACFSTSPVCRVFPMRRHSGGFCCAWLPPPCQSCGAARPVSLPDECSHRGGLHGCSSMSTPPCWSSTATRSRPASATTRSSVADRRITHCSVSRDRAKTSGMASCGRAMPTQPAGRATCSRPALRRVPAGVRSVIVRADKGFYDHALVEWLEAHAARFVIVARLTAPIKRKLGHPCGTPFPATASRSRSFATSRPGGPTPIVSSSSDAPSPTSQPPS